MAQKTKEHKLTLRFSEREMKRLKTIQKKLQVRSYGFPFDMNKLVHTILHEGLKTIEIDLTPPKKK
jgi:hypothetical protein